MISPGTIDEIFAKVQIEDVVQDYVQLKRRGVNMIGLCPFHHEKTPSFTVSPAKNIYKCFGCGKGGNAVQFLMEHDHLTYPEALRQLAAKYNIEIEESVETDEVREERQLKDSLFLINAFANTHFQGNLWENAEGKRIGLGYFKERGFLETTIRKFELGFAPKQGGLTDKATLEGYNSEYLKALGLTTEKGRDFFWDRVMFPIHNLSGKVIGFAGRTMSSGVKGPKYINSPESEIYNKRKTLYAIHLAKQGIIQKDQCILVEGYTDVISLHQAGIQNVVASSGTSLTTDQIALIKRFTPNVLLLYDGDFAGLKASLRGLNLLLEQNLNVQLVALPEGEDPDSFVRKRGSEKMLAYLAQQAKDFILFSIELMVEESKNDPVKKTQWLRDIVESISKIPDPIKRSVYISQCAQLTGIEEAILVAETNKKIRQDLLNKKSSHRDRDAEKAALDVAARRDEQNIIHQQPESPSSAPDDAQERDIVRLLITFGDRVFDEDSAILVAQYILNNIKDVVKFVDNQTYLKVIEMWQHAIKEQATLTLAHFINHTDENIRRLAVDLTTSPYTYSENWEARWDIMLQTQVMPDDNYIKDSQQSVLRFKLKKIRHLIEENKQRIAELKPDEEPQKELIYLKVHQQLTQLRNELAEKLKLIVLS
ncbi:MAG: DNA primase [Saprospiraceae bacterium]